MYFYQFNLQLIKLYLIYIYSIYIYIYNIFFVPSCLYICVGSFLQ